MIARPLSVVLFSTAQVPTANHDPKISNGKFRDRQSCFKWQDLLSHVARSPGIPPRKWSHFIGWHIPAVCAALLLVTQLSSCSSSLLTSWWILEDSRTHISHSLLSHLRSFTQAAGSVWSANVRPTMSSHHANNCLSYRKLGRSEQYPPKAADLRKTCGLH